MLACAGGKSKTQQQKTRQGDGRTPGATTGTQKVDITLADTTTVSETLPDTLSGNENTAIALSGKNAITVSDTDHARPAQRAHAGERP